eukprot:COSAG02_NODE_65376_length_258_cov_0.647799_1_plen_53_part_10
MGARSVAVGRLPVQTVAANAWRSRHHNQHTTHNNNNTAANNLRLPPPVLNSPW